jgi:hypothetical protein
MGRNRSRWAWSCAALARAWTGPVRAQRWSDHAVGASGRQVYAHSHAILSYPKQSSVAMRRDQPVAARARAPSTGSYMPAPAGRATRCAGPTGAAHRRRAGAVLTVRLV